MVGLVGKLLSGVTTGLLDSEGIATNAAYDALKYVTAQGYARLRDPAIRAKILAQSTVNLIEEGMDAEQAAYLVGVVQEKNLLARGVRDDPRALMRIVREEIEATGRFPLECRALERSMILAIVRHTSPNPHDAMLQALAFLNTEVLVKEHVLLRREVLSFMQAKTRTPREAVDEIAAFLKQSGQHEARLEIDSDGRVGVRGKVHVFLQATGGTAHALEAAINALGRGENGLVHQMGEDDLKLTSGNAELDALMQIGRRASAMAFAPATHPLSLSIRPRGGAEVVLTATELFLSGPPPARRITLSDQEHRKFIITVKPTTLGWHSSVNFKTPPVTEADRPLLRALVALGKSGTKLYEAETGDRIIAMPEPGPELMNVANHAQDWLSMLDLYTYLRDELPDAVYSLDIPEEAPLSTREALITIHGHIAGTLEGSAKSIHSKAILTEEKVRTYASNGPFEIEFHYTLNLPGWTPLLLLLNVEDAVITFQYKGRPIKRKRLKGLIGEEVEISLSGRAGSSTLSVAPPDEIFALPTQGPPLP